MNKIAQALNQLKQQDGLYSAENLTMYKKASAAAVLGEVYPRVADSIVSSFFKQASVGDQEETVLRTVLFGRGLTKIAGTELSTKEETLNKLATVAELHKQASVSVADNNLACYHLICDLIK